MSHLQAIKRAHDRSLPHCQSTERAVLAAVLLRPEIIHDIPLDTSHFYLERHQLLWSAYQRLTADGIPIDLRTLEHDMRRHKSFDAAGGLAYLSGLDLDLPDLARIDSYVAILQDHKERRQLIRIGSQTIFDAFASEQTTDALVSDLQRKSSLVGDLGEKEAAIESLLDGVLDTVEKRHHQRNEHGTEIFGLATGIPMLDSYLGGLYPGLHLLAGAPNLGKSTLAVNIARDVARHTPVLFLTFENSPENILLKILCGHAGTSAYDANMGKVNPSFLRKSAEELQHELSNITILPGRPSLTVSQLKARLRKVLQSSPSALLILDYLQLMASSSSSYRNFNDDKTKIDTLLGDLGDLWRSLRIPILIISSQSRAGGSYGSGSGKAALDSLKGSGDIEFAADSASFLTKDEESTAPPSAEAIDLTLKKNRHGPKGKIKLHFYPAQERFFEVSPRS